MTKITSLSTITVALLALGLAAPAPAHALTTQTWVSGTGSNGNPCTRAATCRTFAHAITETAAGGEIDVVDSGEYGAVTITKAIGIVNDGGGVASIQTGSGMSGVTINADANGSVHLRGLTIDGLRTGANGIKFNTGLNLAIENCVIRGFTTAGINISAPMSSFSASNTIASNNPGEGILVQPPGGIIVTGVLSQVTANNNGLKGIALATGGAAGSFTFVDIVDSETSNNGDHGVAASSTPVMLRNVVASNNRTGLEADNAAVLRVAHSLVTGNATGVNVTTGGTIFSYGDNDIDGNTNDNTGALTPLAMH